MRTESGVFDRGASKSIDSGIGKNSIDIGEYKNKSIETEDVSIKDNIEIDKIETDSNSIEVDDGEKTSVDSAKKSEAERIEEKSNYSPEVNSYMRSEAELGIYQKAGLEEQEIGEKKALIRNDINWDMLDEKGRTNTERVKRGLAPLDSNGDSIELHHVGQKLDSPLAELTFEEHRGKGNDTILHDKTIQSETHAEGTKWDTERQDYWVSRAEYNREVAENE